MDSLKKAKSDQLHEGIVARSSTEWADLVMKSMGIDKDDPDKNKRLWGYEIKENVFSSGSDLTLDDYLRLRVVWYTWTSLKTLGNHMRDNDDPERDSEDTGRTKTPYQGFVSHASDLVANKIYTSIKALPEWTAYLDDIRQGGVDGDGTRPSLECGILFMARYWQAMSMAQLKETYGEHDVKELFRGKVRKSEAGMIKPHVHTGALQIRPLSTPSKRIQPHLSHQGFGTPLISNPGPSAGGKQNPATADETYVNTALLLLLQAVTRLMIDCHRQITTSSNTGSSKSKDTRGSEVQARKPSLLPTKKKTLASSRGNKGKETEGASASRGSSSQSGAVTKEIGNQDATDLVKKLSGLCYLDWMADRLPLVLTDRSGLDTEPTRLMEARIDGYLCRRDFIRDSSPSPRLHTRFNKYPLAILEAKPCTRRSGITPIRWQESAEIASWVSGLDEKYESAGLLRTSTSGRKRFVCPHQPSTCCIYQSLWRWANLT